MSGPGWLPRLAPVGENFLYVFKAAASAALARRLPPSAPAPSPAAKPRDSMKPDVHDQVDAELQDRRRRNRYGGRAKRRAVGSAGPRTMSPASRTSDPGPGIGLRRPGPPALDPGSASGGRDLRPWTRVSPRRPGRRRSGQRQARCSRAMPPAARTSGPGPGRLREARRHLATRRAPQATRPRPAGEGRTSGGALHLPQQGVAR